ncbi:unnamed protein product, partial [marine sediment metagenome]
MRGAPSDPQKYTEMCQQRSESLKHYLSNPEAREKRSETLKAYLSSHPEVKQERIEQLKRLQPLAVEKAREKTLGKPLSEEHKNRIRETKLKSGYHHSEKTRQKIGEAGEGRIPWNKGRKCPETSKKLKGRIQPFRGKKNPNMARKGEKNPFYGKKHTEESLKKMFKSLAAKPNKPEQFLIHLFQENDIPLRYVGDGQVIIDGKCPDFINNNGGKQLLELFGERWHELEEEQERKKAFAEYGFETLII